MQRLNASMCCVTQIHFMIKWGEHNMALVYILKNYLLVSRNCDQFRGQAWHVTLQGVHACHSWGALQFQCWGSSCCPGNAAINLNHTSHSVKLLWPNDLTPHTNLLMPAGLQLHITYPILFTYPSRVLEIPCPRKTQCSHLEITVREHVSQTELIIILFWNKKKKNGKIIYIIFQY
jgi:hypothetical protein